MGFRYHDLPPVARDDAVVVEIDEELPPLDHNAVVIDPSSCKYEELPLPPDLDDGNIPRPLTE